jgi:hypothetical protein
MIRRVVLHTEPTAGLRCDACRIWLAEGVRLFDHLPPYAPGQRCPERGPAGRDCPGTLWRVTPAAPPAVSAVQPCGAERTQVTLR